MSEAKKTKAAQDVLAERQRQIEREGWTPEHDDEHSDGAMALAAGKYAGAAGGWTSLVGWPWAQEWWKPSTPRRMLVKAGALILAEIERLDRAAGSADGSGVLRNPARPLTREEEDAAWDSVTEQGCSCCTAAVRLFCRVNGIELRAALTKATAAPEQQEQSK